MTEKTAVSENRPVRAKPPVPPLDKRRARPEDFLIVPNIVGRGQWKGAK